MKTAVRNWCRRLRGYALAFTAGACCTLALLLTYGVPLGVALLNLGDRVAMAGGAEPVLDQSAIEALIAERVAEYARGDSRPLKVAGRR
jgi:hypothetical protein